jgi:hypothetical protein
MCQEILDGEIWGEKRLTKKKTNNATYKRWGRDMRGKNWKKKKKTNNALTGDEGEIWGENERYEGKKSKKIGKNYINAYVCIS